MKGHYDRHTDTLTFRLGKGGAVDSDESKPGIIIDYDKDGNMIGLEILDASKQRQQEA